MDENIVVGSVVMIAKSLPHEASGMELKGAKGIVRLYFDSDTAEEPDEVMLEWTPDTLASFPEGFYLNSFDQELSWNIYVVPVNILKPVEESVDEKALAWQKHDVFTRYIQEELGREGRAVAKAFDSRVDRASVTPLELWSAYLAKNMTFPVKCVTCYPYEEGDGPIKEGQSVLLTGLNGFDRVLGVLGEVEVEVDGKEFILPLQDINAEDQRSKNARFLNSYGLWMICMA